MTLEVSTLNILKIRPESLIDFIADSKDDLVRKSSGKAATIAVPISGS
jgi:hypothetical protein